MTDLFDDWLSDNRRDLVSDFLDDHDELWRDFVKERFAERHDDAHPPRPL